MGLNPDWQTGNPIILGMVDSAVGQVIGYYFDLISSLFKKSLGDWYDNDGKKLTYLNWFPGQPNHAKAPQDYASIFRTDGTWGDFNDDPPVHGWNPGQVVCLQQLNSPGMYSRLPK